MRGWHSYYGYLSGGEDYFNHKAGGYVDLTEAHVIENASAIKEDGLPFEHHAVMNATGAYSTQLFANRTIDLLYDHAANYADKPFFLYLAFQSVHSPLQAPQEYIDKYSYITNKNRRTLAAMSTCMVSRLQEQQLIQIYNHCATIDL
jgi:arylsulfatase A-like enzyme